jgi:hypothetical protein
MLHDSEQIFNDLFDSDGDEEPANSIPGPQQVAARTRTPSRLALALAPAPPGTPQPQPPGKQDAKKQAPTAAAQSPVKQLQGLAAALALAKQEQMTAASKLQGVTPGQPPLTPK